MARTRKVQMQTPTGTQEWSILLKKMRSYWGLCVWDKQQTHLHPAKSLESQIKTRIHEASHVALGKDATEFPIERIEHNVFELIKEFIPGLMED